MKHSVKFAIAFTTLLLAACAPRDTTHYYSIQEALNSPEAKEVLDPKIKLYFGRPAPGSTVKAGMVSNRKTNAANKSDEKSCQWAFLTVVKQFQDTAKKHRATKVGNIISFYKKNPYRSTTQYECHAGNLMSGVALKGDIVR
ncbi:MULTISPECIES: excinuclease ABC subunit A [unclassified Avibacterium]|uniref:excinuclease ABC subunit A n=1 Tax=unclassified Avibacterium TaxID=2685287 RepID=UPI0020271B1F|nr:MULTISPECIES: excinuclease ABC subunit A [unclassified Avibacterium]URL02229.1 excinuclease ABC subunit A [Avibacterium sp. 20-126]MCW9698919.1 excinuclease ABC subunit A [Avibacterium sp. 20-129]MCW9732700.1 excinuclease ABC subunit A [Avibacterium sp. 20-15]URL04848.1 excinuclease ABC subunit A [Avibacterium sp. 20-132]URL06866.1 excinuclease ABC subunit A [Avibacterium sp. 21-595]